MIVGLQGSGKTTSTGKLARYPIEERPLADDGFGGRLPSGGPQSSFPSSLATQAADLRRYSRTGLEAVELARSARKEAVQTGRDTLLVDTAGRLHIDEELMNELQQLKELLNPTEILFVADAMTGQDAVQLGGRVSQAPGHHGCHSHEDGRRRARRRGAVDPHGHRSATEVRRRRREVRRAGAVPSRIA